MTNIALDAGFLQNKLWITAEYYIKTTSDMIMDDNSLLNAWGVGGAARVNIGSMENRGFDLTINYQDVVGDLKYNLSTNITKVTNKIIRLTSNADQRIEGGAFHALEYYTLLK